MKKRRVSSGAAICEVSPKFAERARALEDDKSKCKVCESLKKKLRSAIKSHREFLKGCNDTGTAHRLGIMKEVLVELCAKKEGQK